MSAVCLLFFIKNELKHGILNRDKEKYQYNVSLSTTDIRRDIFLIFIDYNQNLLAV